MKSIKEEEDEGRRNTVGWMFDDDGEVEEG